MELVSLPDLPIHCHKYQREFWPELVKPDFLLHRSAMDRDNFTCSFTSLQRYKSCALVKQDRVYQFAGIVWFMIK
jgi:hypothetical protein